jgi:hypothetical protein
MTIISMPMIAVFAILSALGVIQVPVYAWQMLVFMIMLFIHW